MLRALAGLQNNGTFNNPTFTGTVKGVRASLACGGIPFINISSGSIGNNGALTAVTALPETYSNGAWCYFPANAISASSAAGWYWVVFSSTTAGTIYNSTYTSGAPLVGTTTAFSTTGPGAYTGDTSERAGPTITVPANLLGANGQLRSWTHFIANNTAGAKNMRVRYNALGGTAFGVQSLTTGISSIGECLIANRGVTGAQYGMMFGATAGSAIVYPGTTADTIDTTAATTWVISLQKAVATDNSILGPWFLDYVSN